MEKRSPGSWARESTPEVTGEGFTEHEHCNTLIDLPSGEEVTSSGVSYRVTVPDEGVVLLEAGRVEFNEAGEVVFVAAPHQELSGNFDKHCGAALRGISGLLTWTQG
jgi:hypothetical protein